MILTSLIFTSLMWIIIGSLVTMSARLSRDFDKRFFPAGWLVIMGPLGPVVWCIYSYREKEAASRTARQQRIADKRAK